ncbi:MAG: ribonuclease Z [Ignavibacteriaceae bacterium]|nr:ribonuclease Z [Ignavibacteriaceae bacterium]
MQIKFIGTGSGKTSLKRFHSSLLITSGNYNLLFDCGDGTARAMLSSEIPFNSVDAILISHLHPDHYSGLVSLIVQMKMNNRKNPLQIFINEASGEFIKSFLLNSYLLPERMEFELKIELFKLESEQTINDQMSFFSLLNSHLQKYREYKSAEKISLNSSSFIFNLENKSIYISGDIGSSDDLSILKNRKLDLMILESTHLRLNEIINLSENFPDADIYLTHIDDDDENDLFQFLIGLNAKLRNRIMLAADGETVII